MGNNIEYTICDLVIMNNRVNYYDRTNRYARNDEYSEQKRYSSTYKYTGTKPSNSSTFYRGYDNYHQGNKVTQTFSRPSVVAPIRPTVACKVVRKLNEPKTQKVIFSRDALMKLMNIKFVPAMLVKLDLECIDIKTNCLKYYKQIKMPKEEEESWQRGSRIEKLEHHENGYIVPKMRTVNNDDEIQKLRKDIKAVLNRLTPENFAICLKEITDINFGSEDGMNCLVNEVVGKATLEPTYSPIYARLCSSIGNIEFADKTIRSRLLKRCQTMFLKPLNMHMEEIRQLWVEKVEKETDERMKNMYKDGIEEHVCKAKDKYFGNLKFLSELYMQKQLSGKIVLKCIGDLLNDNASSDTIDGVCLMLPVCGKSLEATFPEDMNKLMLDITVISKSTKFERKSRFKLMDIIDMRNRKWEMREIQKLKNVAPKTLDEIKEEEKPATLISKNNYISKAPSANAWRPRSMKH